MLYCNIWALADIKMLVIMLKDHGEKSYYMTGCMVGSGLYFMKKMIISEDKYRDKVHYHFQYIFFSYIFFKAQK